MLRCDWSRQESSHSRREVKLGEPYKVYMNLIWLNGEIGTGAGDVAGGEGWGPTQNDLEVLDAIEKDLTAAKSDYRDLVDKELPAFNRSLAEHGVTPVASVMPKAEQSGEASN